MKVKIKKFNYCLVLCNDKKSKSNLLGLNT